MARLPAFFIPILLVSSSLAFAQKSADPLYQGFLHPPDDARPMMRWWWFGPAVEKDELAKELRTMHDAGIGGVEIQPVYPLALDDTAKGIRNLKYLSPEFLDDVGFANRTARSLGMRVDITLGSGWPYGGPTTTLDQAAGALCVAWMPIETGVAASPSLAHGETLIAAFAVDDGGNHFDPAKAVQIDLATRAVPAGSGKNTALFFIASHTGQQVKRAAYGAEGNVLDHFARAAIDQHLRDVATPLLGAFGDKPPYSVFSDSLEVYDSDWTAHLPEEFRKRRGYDLVPHLPELLEGGSPQADAVRHDWGKTLAELVRENYLAPLADFATAHHTLFRSQTYGDPAVTLADEATPQLIEGEGMQWREFSYCRWATSAAHLYGRNVVSAETWTWLHSPAFRATPLDMKAEADRMFLLGVNQFVGHGWPYSPPSAGEPGWAFYAAAVFNQHNPWFAEMPEITKYMTRVSWILRQGKPANDVAILLPEDDAQAAFTPGHLSVTEEMQRLITPELMAAILDAGYNVDYIDAATIEKLGKIPYRALIVPPTERMPLSTVNLLLRNCITLPIIVVGKAPTLAPGLLEQNTSAELAERFQHIYYGAECRGQFVEQVEGLPAALHRALAPDLDAADNTAGLGFIHRELPGRDIYFVANTGNQAVDARVLFRSSNRHIQVWNAESGAVDLDVRVDRTGRVPLHLEPYESRIVVLSPSSRPATAAKMMSGSNRREAIEDLKGGWSIAFGDGEGKPTPLEKLVSWTEIPGRQNYSGEGIYSRTFTRPKTESHGLWIDFGEGKAIADDRPAGSNGMFALLDPPIREAAIVYVNGKRAGALWHPPYRIDITELVHPGENRLEVHVYNTAMNELAGQPPRDYSALWAKYGKRFEPQDMDKVKPEASGLLGPVRLMVAPVQ